MKLDALISACGTFRYWLSRQWDASLPWLFVIMLNPSTADAAQGDHTVTKLIEFGKRLGYGGLWILNLYAYRATSPRDLKSNGLQVGPENDEHLLNALSITDSVLCAWGGNAKGHERERVVRKLLKMCGIKTYALHINDDGTPAHPLMLPYSCRLQEFTL